MKRGKFLLYIFFFSLLFFNVYWILKAQNFAKTNKHKKNQIDQLNNLLNSINQSNDLQYRITSHYINMNLELINEKGHLAKLNSIHNSNKPLFVVRYGAINCQTCLDEHIKKIVEILTDTIVTKNIIFLAKYSNLQDIVQFKRIHNIKSCIYRMDNNITPIDSLNIPYYFLLKGNGEITLPHVPISTHEDLTRKYLTIIKHQFN